MGFLEKLLVMKANNLKIEMTIGGGGAILSTLSSEDLSVENHSEVEESHS